MATKELPDLDIGHLTTASGKQALKRWLFSEVSLAWAESLLKEHPHQFDKLEREWDSFKSLVAEGDIVWLWSVHRAYKGREHTEGYSIIRGRKVIATLAIPQRTALDVITSRSERPPKRWLRKKVTVRKVDAQLRNGLLAD